MRRVFFRTHELGAGAVRLAQLESGEETSEENGDLNWRVGGCEVERTIRLKLACEFDRGVLY